MKRNVERQKLAAQFLDGLFDYFCTLPDLKEFFDVSAAAFCFRR